MAGFRSGVSTGATITVQIDMDKIGRALAAYGDEMQVVGLSRALNRGGRAGGALLVRALAEQTGLQQKVIREIVTQRPATRSSLRFTYTAKAPAMGLAAFGLRGGVGSPKGSRKGQRRSYQVWARPWGRKQVFRRAFIVPVNGINQAFTRKPGAKGRHNLHMIYGPVVPYEMVRPGEETVRQIFQVAIDVAERRLPHELAYAAAVAAQKTGT